VSDKDEIASALRQIARGFDALARAIASDPAAESAERRIAELLREWGERGLSREEASALFRKHGFAPQAAGGWARGDWIELREDGRRYATERSRRWIAEQED
jgi:predicted AlkP superfamily pyrophosphatase or phosphodiesterase